ncbi:MAG TPA: alpha/beta hydrolase [Solirubrobacter sp.]|nr:alpha/beta hydrolase [Solirubrobacter sp.]
MFASSGGARIAYDVTGSGPDVLLIHAGVNDRRSWKHVVARLAPHHRCIAYDMRGYGETTYEREEGWAPVTDALAVLDAAHAGRVAIVAASMGGQCAIDLTLAHPERVSRLVLIGTAIRGAPYPTLKNGPTAELNAQIDAAGDDVELIERLEAHLWLDGASAPEGRVSNPTRALFLDMNARPLRAPDPGDQREPSPAWPHLGDITVPTLLLLGRLDAEDIEAINEQAVELIPGAKIVHLDGVAHVPHLEGDRATLDAIAAFLGG